MFLVTADVSNIATPLKVVFDTIASIAVLTAFASAFMAAISFVVDKRAALSAWIPNSLNL